MQFCGNELKPFYSSPVQNLVNRRFIFLTKDMGIEIARETKALLAFG
jgi:hypothetical protein